MLQFLLPSKYRPRQWRHPRTRESALLPHGGGGCCCRAVPSPAMTTMFLSGAGPSSTPQADSFLTSGGALSIPPGGNALCLSPGDAPSLVSSNSVAQQPRSCVAQAAAEAAAQPSPHGSTLMRPDPCQWRPWQPGPTPMADADVAAPITFLALDGGGGGGHTICNDRA